MQIVTLQPIINDTDEAYKVSIGIFKLIRLICYENEADDTDGSQTVTKPIPTKPVSGHMQKSPGMENDWDNVRFIQSHDWEEIDPFTGLTRGRRFSCNTSNLKDLIFTCDNSIRGSIRYNQSPELMQRKNTCMTILADITTSDRDKANSLLLQLLGIQCCLDDPDREEDDRYGYIYTTLYTGPDWADFYDTVRAYIKHLDIEIWEANENQVWLPSLIDED